MLIPLKKSLAVERERPAGRRHGANNQVQFLRAVAFSLARAVPRPLNASIGRLSSSFSMRLGLNGLLGEPASQPATTVGPAA